MAANSYFIIGFMGSGKSTLAQLIAQKLNLAVFDLDQLIEKKYNSSIANLFTQFGENAFRQMEHDTLQELINNQNNFVLSTGGGTPCFFSSIELMKNKGKVIYLKASNQTLLNRLLLASDSRPLLAGLNEEEMLHFIDMKLNERNSFYSQADIIVDANKGPNEVAESIFSHIKN